MNSLSNYLILDSSTNTDQPLNIERNTQSPKRGAREQCLLELHDATVLDLCHLATGGPTGQMIKAFLNEETRAKDHNLSLKMMGVWP